MKMIMKSRSLLCLLALLFVPTLLATAQSTGAETAPSPPPTPSQRFVFEAREFAAPNGGTLVSISLTDALDPSFHKRVLSILSDTNGMTRMQRAKVVAARMQAAADADPEWSQSLRIVSMNKECVVVDGKTGKVIVTADKSSARAANAQSTWECAQMLMTAIQDRLKGIKLR